MNGPTRIDLAAVLLRGALGVIFIAHALPPSRRAAFRPQRAD
jgi:hypothetical protein